MYMDTNQPLLAFEEWFKSLKIVKVNGGPANGTIAATLVVLERLKNNYDLNFENHVVVEGKAQIKGAGVSAVTKILKKLGEDRPFLKEGGRTNRGGQGAIRPLFDSLTTLKLELLPQEERNQILTSFQMFLVERVRDFHNRQKLKLVYDSKRSTWQIIHSLFEASYSEGKAGHFAQHLVGAKLQLRFPEVLVSNESASTADKPTKRSGDFEIGNTVFHVTVSPMEGVFRKCQENLKEGLKVYLIVPDGKLAAARQLAEQYCNGQIAVESLESFISQNIEEISVFASEKLKISMVNLIKLYNERVNAVEVDKSLMIELPSNLEKYNG